jgi:hypothetical protein
MVVRVKPWLHQCSITILTCGIFLTNRRIMTLARQLHSAHSITNLAIESGMYERLNGRVPLRSGMVHYGILLARPLWHQRFLQINEYREPNFGCLLRNVYTSVCHTVAICPGFGLSAPACPAQIS